MIEEIDGFVPALVQIDIQTADLRYFRALPRIGESVTHVEDTNLSGGSTSYQVRDIWHIAWHPEHAAGQGNLPTIVLIDPDDPRLHELQAARLHPDDIDLLAERIAEELARE